MVGKLMYLQAYYNTSGIWNRSRADLAKILGREPTLATSGLLVAVLGFYTLLLAGVAGCPRQRVAVIPWAVREVKFANAHERVARL